MSNSSSVAVNGGGPMNWPSWCCPACRFSLNDRGDALVCEGGHRYPISGGIARFVGSSGYAAAFGLQWNRYRQAQLDSYTGVPISAVRLRRCLGDDLWAGLAGTQVLECGCGAGRFTEVLLAQGAKVVSLDLSDAVDANAENCPANNSHLIAQADIRAIPFAPQSFDVVLCLGVVQHTPSPEETIASLAAQVRPGGWLVFDHYAYNLSWFTKTAPLFRQVFKRLPPETGLHATEWLVDKLLPLHKRVRPTRLGQMLVSRVSPVTCYYQSLPQLSDEQQREWAVLDTHDTLTDTYKHFRTKASLVSTLDSLGMDQVWSQPGGNGIELRARRPPKGL